MDSLLNWARARSSSLIGALAIVTLLAPSSWASDARPSIGFVENCGQFEGPVRYALDRGTLQAYFTRDEVAFSLESGELGTALRLRFVNTSDDMRLGAHERRAGVVHYLRGRRPSDHVTDVPTWGVVAYEGIYPGIDLVYREGTSLKAEWIVRPGASVNTIRFAYEGADSIEVVGDGLRLGTQLGELSERRPFFYQDVAGERRSVEGGFRVNEDGTIGFWVGEYDPTEALVLDPDLEWSTFLGGTQTDAIEDGAVDRNGNVLMAGWNLGGGFPATMGAFQTTPKSNIDGIVAKLSPDGSSLLWATYLGGSDNDFISQVTVDGSGDLYLSGSTSSSDFPVTTGAFDETYNGGASFLVGDGFAAKLGSSGSSLIYSTYLGGSESDIANAITVDSNGVATLTGRTYSSNFPVKAGYDKTYNGNGDIWVAQLNPAGSGLTFSTFLGGSEFEQTYDIAMDRLGDFYLTGLTQSPDYPTTPGAFNTLGGESILTKLDASGTSLVYSTYLAPSGRGETVTVDSTLKAIVGGDTGSGFPVTPGAYDMTYNGGFRDAFVLVMGPDGDKAVYATYLGGADDERVWDVRFGNGRVTATGSTYSSDFPTTPGAYDRFKAGTDRNTDAFITELDEAGESLIYSTFLGGTYNESGVSIFFSSGAPREVTAVGFTYSANFPTTPGAYDRTKNGGTDTTDGWALRMRLGPVIELVGKPSPGNSVHYDVLGAPSSETGFTAQVVLSCSGSSPGVLLPGGKVLPINPDGCTTLGLHFGFLLRTTLAADGQGSTPVITFPSVAPGITVTSAAFTWNTSTGIVFSVTPPITFVTL